MWIEAWHGNVCMWSPQKTEGGGNEKLVGSSRPFWTTWCIKKQRLGPSQWCSTCLACTRSWAQSICTTSQNYAGICLQPFNPTSLSTQLILTLNNPHPLIISESIYLEGQDKYYRYSLCCIFSCSYFGALDRLSQSILEDLTCIRMFLSFGFNLLLRWRSPASWIPLWITKRKETIIWMGS